MTILRTVLSATITTALVAAAIGVAPVAANADDPQATISGHVSAPAGADVAVELYDGTHAFSDEVVPDASGFYSFTITEAGSYAVSFSDEREDSPYVTRFFPGNVIADDPDDPRVTYFPVDLSTGAMNVDGQLSTAAFAAPIAPVISGTPKFGKTLTVNYGEWAEDPDIQVQWFRNNVPIADATDEEYEVASEDLGTSLIAQITAVADGYQTVTLNSAPVSVAASKLTVGTPKITGTAQVGKRLKAHPGIWGPGKVKYTYQWYAGKKAIKKATHSTLKLTKALKKKKIRVAVTGTKVGIGSATKYTKRVKVSA